MRLVSVFTRSRLDYCNAEHGNRIWHKKLQRVTCNQTQICSGSGRITVLFSTSICSVCHKHKVSSIYTASQKSGVKFQQ